MRRSFLSLQTRLFYNSRIGKTTEFISRSCPVCGGGETTPHLRKKDLTLVQCAACAMVYIHSVPPEYASGEYYDKAGTEYYLSPAKLESDYSPVRFERELRLFHRHCPRGPVLDVGCSSGAFLFHLNQRWPGAYQIAGTDVSGAPLDYAESRGVPVLRGSFPKLDFGSRRFAAVTFWAVLEHLFEPRTFSEKAWSILEPQGLCFVLVPNLKSLAVRCLGPKYRYVYPQHLNYFTRRTLERLAGDRFTVLEVRSIHFNPIVIWQDWRRKGEEVPNERRAALLKRTTAYKTNPLLKPVKAVYQLTERLLGAAGLADNLVAVLRKRLPSGRPVP
jgi:2-polyprenyl-3-methyl-5-hydroxy-6-metoxy-1,4-benzoquinol methylase